MCILLNAQTYNEQYEKFLRQYKDSTFSLLEKLDKMNQYFIGSIAPDFKAVDVNGQEVDLNKLKGHFVVLNFWNTECKTCTAQIPEFNQMIQQFATKDVSFITLSPDGEDKVKSFLKKEPFKCPTIANANSIAFEKFKLEAIFPYFIIIGQDNRILKMWFGSEGQGNLLSRVGSLVNQYQ